MMPNVSLSSHPDLTLPALSSLWESTLGWQPSQAQQGLFQRLLGQMYDLNQNVNLTRITDPEAFWEKHLWDSLWGIQPWLAGATELREVEHAEAEEVTLQTLRAVDIGTGGGFPGIPIAIALPHWQVTLLDSTRKKVACLETLCQDLPLSNAAPICDRAENFGQSPRDRATYDLAFVRAVGPVSCCAEYALPLLKVGGTAILYRGQWSAEEESVLQRALITLGGELVELRNTQTPLTQGQRHGIYLRKTQTTPPSFPRKEGLPAKYPLGTGTIPS